MSATTEDPSKYWRAGVAIPVARKAIFDQRMAELDLRTVGDLATLFILGEGIVEVLKPIAQKLRAEGYKKSRDPVREALKSLTTEQLAKLIALAKAD